MSILNIGSATEIHTMLCYADLMKRFRLQCEHSSHEAKVPSKLCLLSTLTVKATKCSYNYVKLTSDFITRNEY